MLSTSAARREPWLLGASLAIVFLGATFSHYRPLLASRDQYDDSYITYRYAVNWAEGRGLVFNRNERADAASSPLYAALLALLYRAGATDLERVGVALGLASGCWAIFMAARCGYRMSRSALATAMFVLPVALSGWLCGWSVSGMETTLYLALVLTFATLYVEDRTFAAAAVLALGMACRSEGVLLWAAAGAAELWSARGAPRRSGWILIGTGAAILLLTLASRFAYYGEVLPQPLLFKRVARYYAPGAGVQLAGLVGFLARAFALPALMGGLWLGATGVGMMRGSGGPSGRGGGARGIDALERTAGSAPGRVRASRVEVFFGLYVTLSLGSIVVGPASDQFRYATHLLPILAVLAATAWTRWSRTWRATRWSTALTAAVACIAIVQAEVNQRATARTFERSAAHQHLRKAMGRWIEARVPPDVRVISADLGAIAYYARSHAFVDPTGLTSRAPLAAALSDDWPAVWAWLDRTHPGLLADTRWPTGEIASQRILEHPEAFFRRVHAAPGRARSLVLSRLPAAPADARTPDGFQYVIRAVQW